MYRSTVKTFKPFKMLQILPFSIDKDGNEPDLDKYFIHDGENGNFRGRKLVGVVTELGKFKGICGKESFSKVMFWNRDTSSQSFSQILNVMDTLNELNE